MLERQLNNIVGSITNTSNERQTNNNILDHYEIHDTKLGEGGFAKVRRGTHKQTGRQVAIKCFDKLKLADELPRVYTEIRILRRLRHPNIAQLYEVFETSTNIYIVLELCSGGELFDYIVSKSKLDEVEANRIFHDLIRVLDYIHLNGIAHRDLKPENVLFDGTKQVKLIDFGLAADCSMENLISNKDQRPMDKLSTCCGSVTYAAPEVISGHSYSGTTVDVWSAGVLLYALVVGQLPFNDPSIPVLYKLIQSGLVKIPSYLSTELADLIRKMLNTNPNERITIRQILLHPWLTKFQRQTQQLNNQQFNLLTFDGKEQIAPIRPTIRPTMSLENRVYRRLQYTGATATGAAAAAAAAVANNRQAFLNNENRVCNVYRTPTKTSRADAVIAIQRSPLKTPNKKTPNKLGSTCSPQNKVPFKTPAKLKYGPEGKKSMIKQWLQLWTPRKLKNPRKVLVASVKHFP